MLNFKSKHPETRNRLISKTWLFLEAENQMINVEIYFTLFKSDKIFQHVNTHTHKHSYCNLIEFGWIYVVFSFVINWKMEMSTQIFNNNKKKAAT